MSGDEECGDFGSLIGLKALQWASRGVVGTCHVRVTDRLRRGVWGCDNGKPPSAQVSQEVGRRISNHVYRTLSTEAASR